MKPYLILQTAFVIIMITNYKLIEIIILKDVASMLGDYDYNDQDAEEVGDNKKHFKFTFIRLKSKP